MSAQVNKRVYQLKKEPDCTLFWTISTIRRQCDSVTFLCGFLVSRRFKASFDANEAAQFTSTRWTVLSTQIQKSQTSFLQRKNENRGQLHIYKTLNKRPSFVNNPMYFGSWICDIYHAAPLTFQIMTVAILQKNLKCPKTRLKKNEL